MGQYRPSIQAAPAGHGAPSRPRSLVVPVLAGQHPGVPAQGGAHLLAAAGRIGAEHEREEPARLLQASPDRGDVTRRVQPGRIPTATQPIGILVSGGTTQPMWTAPPSATLLARPIRAPLKTMAPVAMNTSSSTWQPVR
jgi:hypothetical protein